MRHLPFLFLLFVVSCSPTTSTVKPELHVVNLAFENVTVFETTVLFDVRIDNENPDPIKVDGGVHRLYINDVYIGKGMDRDGFTVGRLDSVTKPVRVQISNVSLFSKIEDLALQDQLSYRIESKLYVGGRSVNVEDKGEFDFLGPLAGTSGRKFGR